MEPNRKHDCCQPLVAALSDDARALSGAGLIVRADNDGALYFKITTGTHEFSDTSVNEPASFCPFCGSPVATADADSPATPRLVDPLEDDEELTVLACSATLVGAAA